MRLIASLFVLLAVVTAACADDMKPDAPLTNTYWKLLTAGTVTAQVAENQQEAHVILRLDGTVGGSSGCNRMSGTYKLEGATLTIGPIAMTRMFCAETAETERAFTAALGKAKGWKIVGDDLTLTDAAGEPVATLVAVYL